MKKFIIQIDQFDRTLEFNSPFRREIGIFDNLVRLMQFTFFKLIAALILLLPISGLILQEEKSETSAFIIVVSILIFLLGLHAFSVILFGSKTVVDPKGIFQVLLYALLLTVSAVLLSEPNANYTENTFGAVGSNSAKGFSGLAVIVYVSFFYLISVFINKRKDALQKIFSLLLISSFAYILFFIFNIVDDRQISLPILLVSLFILIKEVAYSNSSINKYIGLIGIILLMFIVLDKVELDTESLSIYLFSFLVSMLPICFYFAKQPYKTLVQPFQKTIEEIEFSINNYNSSSRDIRASFKWIRPLLSLCLIALPILLVISLLFIFLIEGQLVVFSELFESIQDSFLSVNENIQSLLVGKGSAEVSRNDGMIASVVVGQGFIGLISYVFLWTYMFVTVFKTISSKLGNVDREFRILYLSASATASFIFAISLFMYPGFVVIMLWWLMFIMINSSPENLEESVEGRLEIQKIKSLKIFKNKNQGIFARKLIAALSLLLTVIIFMVFVDLIGEVI